MKERISITIDKKILENLEKERGLIPRSTFLQKMLEEKYPSEAQ